MIEKSSFENKHELLVEKHATLIGIFCFMIMFVSEQDAVFTELLKRVQSLRNAESLICEDTVEYDRLYENVEPFERGRTPI
jgi:hypothetical protein